MFQANIRISFAQFQLLPTPVTEKGLKDYSKNNRLNQAPSLLPFWDDFSKKGVDTTKWINEGATQSLTVGYAPPSYGVLLLDGVDERGRPYSNVLVAQGITDKITSVPIDLSGLSEEEKNTVFISFFWQSGGRGEMPDFNDDLSLFFLDTTDNWISVWSMLPGEQFTFTPEIIQVTEEFQHENFQFRFQISGRASGPFDSWLVDYVYLNKNRNPNDLSFPDRALTKTNVRPLGRFSAIPLFELNKNSNEIWTNSGNEFKNLENRFRAMEYSVVLRDKADNSIVKNINNNTPFNPVPLANERRSFDSNSFNVINLPSEETDYELITYLTTGDKNLFQIINGDTVFFDNIDLKMNDTVKTIIPIRDFFAYDDGNVDYSAGINQRNGMLANRFEVSNAAFVKGISINFTNFTQANSIVDLMIWRNLDENPIYVKEVFIPEKPSLSDFSYFELEENIRVEDIFFVGFTQFTNDFVYVGLDKTFDNGKEVFFNVTGSWQQNDIVEGSLMIRVHLSETEVLEQEGQSEAGFKLFPNPVTDWISLEGEIDDYSVYDPYGRQLNLPMEINEKGKMINFAGLQKGVYLVNIVQNNESKSIRVLVR
ncbi:T9SS C-terminal target domain-containing protein [Cyclobacteriaceae bacterium YHN15]|nr:T9SS C-terminal target domain-containing protein [Cyclobacteriaceae bacterium YHN15]